MSIHNNRPQAQDAPGYLSAAPAKNGEPKS